MKPPNATEKSVLGKPLVSLVITSYNRASMIWRAIDSALAQDYENLEIIISDNCSTDETNEVIARYVNDTRIKYHINDENIGMLSNFIKATNELTQGEFITYLSSDDYLINESFVSQAISRIQQFPSVQLVHSINVSEILETNERFLDYSYEFYKNTFYKQDYVDGIEVIKTYPKCHSISFGGTLFNKRAFLSISPFSGKVFSFDTQIVLQLLQLGDAAFIEKETYVVRRHGGNMTSCISEAKTHIDNLDYIETPYLLAMSRNVLDKDFLRQWRDEMYFNYFSQSMLGLYKVDKSEYAVLVAYINDNHATTLVKITKQVSWHLNKILYANEFSSKMYLLASRWYRRIKLLLLN